MLSIVHSCWLILLDFLYGCVWFCRGFFIPFFLAANTDFPFANLNSFNILQAGGLLLDSVATWKDLKLESNKSTAIIARTPGTFHDSCTLADHLVLPSDRTSAKASSKLGHGDQRNIPDKLSQNLLDGGQLAGQRNCDKNQASQKSRTLATLCSAPTQVSTPKSY